jgi:hypothetical protein
MRTDALDREGLFCYRDVPLSPTKMKTDDLVKVF